MTAPAPPKNVCLQPIKLGSGHLRRRFFATAWTPYNLPTDVSSPRTADRGPSQVEGSKGIVATNWGPTSQPADQWGTGTKDAYLMPPPPTPQRDLTRRRGEEEVGGTYLADPGGGVWEEIYLIGSGGNIPAEQNSLI